ncbi:MAG: T9SS type A sorting domain-containing protein, partial [Bacteroidota bacterium]
GLPVELAGFNGFATEAGVQLKWATLSETDADHFLVERSFRGSTSEFEAIGQVQATGSATKGATYAFVDPSPHAGPTSYRLRQVDLDGRFTFYGPITVESARVADFQLSAYPNPSRGRAVVNIELPVQTRARVEVFNDTGQRIVQLHNGTLAPGRHALRLAGRLSAGRYVIRLVTPETERVAPIVVVR